MPRAAPLAVQTHERGLCVHTLRTRACEASPRGLMSLVSFILFLSLSLSLSFRPTGGPRYSNCDTYRMHSFRVGNVSLDVAERAPHCQRKRRRGNEHYRASIVPRALVHAFTRADVAARPARKYTRAYTHTHTHTHTHSIHERRILEPRDRRRPFRRSSLRGNRDRLESKGNQAGRGLAVVPT